MLIFYLRVQKLQIPKEKANHYELYFDCIKVIVYVIITVVIMEFQQATWNINENVTTERMFWLCAELTIIVWPTILSLQTRILNIFIIVFHFTYLYFRIEGYDVAIIEASFWFAKTIPIGIYMYKLKSFEETSQHSKTKQKEERKLASTVLNLLPDGVAIVDSSGLQYMNDSMRTIIRVKDDQVLDTIFSLENTQFIDDMNNSKVMQKSFSSSYEINKVHQKSSLRGEPKVPSLFSKLDAAPRKSSGENLKERKSDELVSHPSKLSKKPSSNATPPPKKAQEKSPAFKSKTFNFKSGSDKEIGGDQNDKPIDPLISKNEENNDFEEANSIEKEGIVKDESFRGSTQMSLIGLSNLKLRFRKILNKIEEPFQKSNHRTAKEAIDDILSKLKEEFGSETVDGVLPSNASSGDQDKKDRLHKQRKSRSLPLSISKKINPYQNLGANRWAMVMQSTRKTAGGILQYLEIKFTPISLKGRPSIILLIRDVTEKEIIKQMEEKERSQSKVLASVSHEFRTPLNGIMGMLGSLKEHITHELKHTYLVPAYNSAKLLLTLVNDILDFHQIKEQKLILVPVRFNLKKKLEESLTLISTQAKARGLKLKINMDPKMSKYICNDPNRVQQVVNNLLGNAIKFTLEGSITIQVEPYQEKKVAIKVIDTGIGIESANIEKLFKAFGKIDSKRNRELNPQGVGLGLTISNSLAKVLCSQKQIAGLNVTSEVHKGSTFWFVIDDQDYELDPFEVEDEDDENKNLDENLEELMGKYHVFNENMVSNSVFNYANTITSLKDAASPAFRGTILPTSFGSTGHDNLSPIKSELFPTEPDKNQNSKVRKKVQKKTLAMNENISVALQKIKEKSGTLPTILLADDDDINHMVFKNFLGAFEVDIHSVYNGKQALQKIQERKVMGPEHQYISIFLDVEMPIMGGIQCAREIRALIDTKQIPNLPIIGQSGHGGQEEVQKCRQAGMTHYLQKPIAKDKLIELLADLLPK